MGRLPLLLVVIAALGGGLAPTVQAAPIVFESAGADPASITAARDAFRIAIGGGTVAGADGSFGGARREINWDGVPDALSDPNLLPANFFNTSSPRGVVFSTPGTGFLVSARAGTAVPPLFDFGTDFQAFSPERLFTAVNSNVTDLVFYLPGTSTAATTSAFGLVFVDVETAGQTTLSFFDADDRLLFSRSALVAGNRGLSFLGVHYTDGTAISRVRIVAGSDTLLSNGVRGTSSGDLVVMDDFLYAEPLRVTAVPEPGSMMLIGLGLAALTATRRPHRSERARARGR